MYVFAPEKPPGLVGRNFLLSHLMVFCESIKQWFDGNIGYALISPLWEEKYNHVWI
jgi:hypothetical protein